MRVLPNNRATVLMIVWACAPTLSGTADAEPRGPDQVVEVMGLTCSGVDYYEDGTPEFCTLAKAGTVSGQEFPAETGVHFTRAGVFDWCFLHEDTEIQGVPCAKFRFLSAVCWPIHGKKGGTDFHDNGHLASCELSEAVSIEGRRFKRRSAIRFDYDGKLIVE